MHAVNIVTILLTIFDIFMLVTIFDIFMHVTIFDIFMHITIFDIFMHGTIFDIFMHVTIFYIFMHVTIFYIFMHVIKCWARAGIFFSEPFCELTKIFANHFATFLARTVPHITKFSSPIALKIAIG